MTIETCPECGAVIAGGRAGCQSLWEAFVFAAYEDARLASMHALAFDTYCMQHVETYCVSAKSYAAHLTRLCVGIEYEGKQNIYAALQRWYHAEIVKPDVLRERGHIWMTDVMALDDVEAKIAKIYEWAHHVWDVYASQHALAHQWVKNALGD